MLEECKSQNHNYKVGDQVFDLPSQQMVTILNITLVTDDPLLTDEERQSVNPTDAWNIGHDYFVVTVDAPADFPGSEAYGPGRLLNEFCLPEEAERFRGRTCI
jgi:hypothetical protein